MNDSDSPGAAAAGPSRPGADGERAAPVLSGPVDLSAQLDRQKRQFARLWQIVHRINRGLSLDDVLDFVYEEFRDIIPYNRIAFALVDHEAQRVTARWARTDGLPKFPAGYSLAFAETSLMDLARTGRPRIINDLAAYVREKPGSEVTRMLIEEGLRSSLTCPLIVEGRPVGFLFFDHQDEAVYSNVHVEFFVQLAEVISVAVERGRMFSELTAKGETIERQNRLLAEENQRNQRELQMARTVQQALVPRSLPRCDNLELAMMYEPAGQVGGDMLDAVRLADDRMLLYMADAMGHGVPAALLMSVVRTAFHAALADPPPAAGPSPAALLTHVNRTVIEMFETNYVTAVCALVDLRRGRLTVAQAGHPPTLIKRARGGQVVSVAEGGIPLGIELDSSYSDVDLPIGPGDLALLYTDGVIEAATPDGVFYGLQGLRRFLDSAAVDSPQALVERLREELARHCDCAARNDDMTVLAAKLTGAP